MFLAFCKIALGVGAVFTNRTADDTSKLRAEPATASPLVLRIELDGEDFADASLRFTVSNTGDEEVTLFPMHLPCGGKGGTHLVVLYNQRERIDSPCHEIDAGIPTLASLERISIAPEASYTTCVPLSRVVGAEPTPGRYDVAGVWAPPVTVGGRHVTVSLPVPLVSFDLTQRRGRDFPVDAGGRQR